MSTLVVIFVPISRLVGVVLVWYLGRARMTRNGGLILGRITFRVEQASTSGNVDVINLLLKKGADVSVTDKDGVTTLMSSASHGHAQVG